MIYCASASVGGRTVFFVAFAPQAWALSRVDCGRTAGNCTTYRAIDQLAGAAGNDGKQPLPRGSTGIRRESRVKPSLVFALGVAVVCADAGVAGEFECVIEPRQVLELRSPLDGLIEKITVDRGDTVKEGQVLVMLDTTTERAQAEIARYRSQMDGALNSSQSRVEFSTRKFERARNLYGGNYISEQARDEVATEKRLAEAELTEARDNRRLAELEYQRQMAVIKLKTIRSPISGVVTERLQNPGELAEAGVGRKPILKLAEIDTLNVEVLLPLEAYGQVKRGMGAVVIPEVPSVPRVNARVTVIDRVLDAASGTFAVRLEFRNPDQRVPGGIRCRVDIPGVSGGKGAGARTGRGAK